MTDTRLREALAGIGNEIYRALGVLEAVDVLRGDDQESMDEAVAIIKKALDAAGILPPTCSSCKEHAKIVCSFTRVSGQIGHLCAECNRKRRRR